MKQRLRPPHGLIPIVATPFDAQGNLDEESLQRLITFQLEAGADGIALFGMASEAFTLTSRERERILRVSRAVTAGTDLQVIAGVAATSIRGAIEQLSEAADGGATTIMAMPPFMVKPAVSQLLDFYAELAAAASGHGMQVMVQDAPGTTGVTIEVETLDALAKIPALSAVKIEAPPTVPKIQSVTDRIESDSLAVLGGQNSQFVLDEYSSGAVGTMPACEFTDLLAPIIRDWNDGQLSAARAAFTRLLPLVVWGLQPGLAWAVHKEVLVARGLISNATVRAPAKPLSNAARKLLAELLTEMGLGVPVLGTGA